MEKQGMRWMVTQRWNNSPASPLGDIDAAYTEALLERAVGGSSVVGEGD